MRNGPVIKAGLGEEFPSNIPKQYLQGWVEFYKLKLKVTSDVLIPRPETELLVDEVLNYCHLLPVPCSLILDIGTGSGNIAIAIAKNAPKVKIFATDISDSALAVARDNAKKHRVEKRIFFTKNDLLSDLNYSSLKPTSYNLVIVTNLPYIPSSRISYLDPSVKDFEPRIALDGGPDGFDLYRQLFVQLLKKNLIPGLLVGEIDYTQGELATNEAIKYFPKAKVEVKKDLAHKQRILLIRF